MKCSVCGGEVFSELDTYKHTWRQCVACQTVVREGKAKSPLQGPLLDTALSAASFLFPGKARSARKTLAVDPGVHASPDEFYRYYAESVSLDYGQTKWKKYDDQFLARLAEMGVVLSKKRVLSISDGPGFIAKRIASEVESIVITEISPAAVEVMREKLGIDARVYDFNRHALSDVVNGQFDCVFLRSCIDFCEDIGALARSLRAVVAPGGCVYFIAHAPSRGDCLQWMFDDYTSNRWYPPEVMVRVFEAAGFRSQFSHTRYRSALNNSKAYPKPALLTAIQEVYRLKAQLENPNFSSESESVQYACLFR